MRRAAAILLVLLAALAAPLRQACGTTCVGTPEAPAVAAAAHETQSAGSCHKPEPAPEPVPAPSHCAHDHSGGLLQSTRVAAVEPPSQPALFEAAPVHRAFLRPIGVAASPSDLSPGSPPVRVLTLRI